MQQLSDAFSAAPLETGGWERALRLLAAATGSARGQLIGIGGPSLVPFNWVTDIDAEALREFVAIDGGSASRNFRIAASRGPMEIVHEEDYATVQPLLSDDVYNDYCREQDIPGGIQTVLREGPDGFTGLAVLRTARDGVSSAEQRALFAAAAPLALAAFRTQRALDSQGELLLAGALEAMTVAACVLDEGATATSITPAAERALADDTRLCLEGRRLRAGDRDSQVRLDVAVARALDGAVAASIGTTIAIHDPMRLEAPLLVTVSRLGPGPWTMGQLPRVLVVVRGHAPDRPTAELLQQAFGLTRGEADVAAGIVRGMSREQIAAERGSSQATVQTQIKSIFAKTGVNREGALAAKLRTLLEL